VATVGAASLSLIVPVAEAVPGNSKGLIDSAIVSAVVGTPNRSRSSTRRYSYCL
jgi:energy-converting hydrogenase Eha subunit A